MARLLYIRLWFVTAVISCELLPGIIGQFQSTSRIFPSTISRSIIRPRGRSTFFRDIPTLNGLSIQRAGGRIQTSSRLNGFGSFRRQSGPVRISTRLTGLPPSVQRILSRDPRTRLVPGWRPVNQGQSTVIQQRRKKSPAVHPGARIAPRVPGTIVSTGTGSVPIKTQSRTAGKQQPIIDSARIQPLTGSAGLPAHITGSGIQAHATVTGIQINDTGIQAHASTAGVQSHVTGAGIQAHASTAGVQSHVTGAGIQAHASTAGVQSHVTGAGIQAHASTAGVQLHVTGAGTQAHASTAGVQSHVTGAGTQPIPIASTTVIQSASTSPEDAFQQELVDVFTSVLEGILAPQSSVVQTVSQPMVPITQPMGIHQPIIQPFGPGMQFNPYSPYSPMSGIGSVDPWTLPAYMQEMWYGDTQDPPDGVTTTAAPVKSPTTGGTVIKAGIAATDVNASAPVTGVIKTKVPIKATVNDAASVVAVVADTSLEIEQTQNKALKTLGMKATDTSITSPVVSTTTEIKAELTLTDVKPKETLTVDTSVVKAEVKLPVTESAHVAEVKVNGVAAGVAVPVINTLDIKKEATDKGIELNLKQESISAVGSKKKAVEVNSAVKPDEPGHTHGLHESVVSVIAPVIVDKTKQTVSTLADKAHDGLKSVVTDQTLEAVSTLADKAHDGLKTVLVDQTKEAVSTLAEKAHGGLKSVVIDQTKDVVSAIVDKTHDGLKSVIADQTITKDVVSTIAEKAHDGLKTVPADQTNNVVSSLVDKTAEAVSAVVDTL